MQVKVLSFTRGTVTGLPSRYMEMFPAAEDRYEITMNYVSDGLRCFVEKGLFEQVDGEEECQR